MTNTIIHIFFTIALYSILFSAVVVMTSCNQKKDSNGVIGRQNEVNFLITKKEDVAFLILAAEINLKEIELGKLAQKKSSMPEVVELGEMMEEQHTEALQDLKLLAINKKIIIPTTLSKKDSKIYKELKQTSGLDFDNKYSNMMVIIHKEAINVFEDGFSDTKDVDIQYWAASTLTTLRTHLDHSIACQEKCKQIRS